MDYTIFWIIGIIGSVVGLVYLVSYLRKNNYVAREDLVFASEVLSLTLRVIDELDLAKEKEIKKISEIVVNAINFSVGLYDDEVDLVNQSYNFAIDLCEQANIEITENRKEIIRELVIIGIKNKDLIV